MDPAADRIAAVTSLDQWVSAQAARAWRSLRPNALQQSFVDSVLPSLLPSLRQAQAAAANMGATAMSRALADAGNDPAAHVVNPEGFAGHASDGGSLVSLLAVPLVETYVDLGAGIPADEALDRSFGSLNRILVTQIHDAARSAEQTQLVADQTITYWIRITEPSACDRCIILSGKRYKWNADFLRHPSCRCSSQAETEASPVILSPKQIFENMSHEERVRAFGVANTRAIELGADLYRVVNATGSRSGMSTTITDSSGRVLKGTYVGARKGHPRLVPEAIFQLAGDDRAKAIQLLTRNGYLVAR
jgi:hypothetical protein